MCPGHHARAQHRTQPRPTTEAVQDQPCDGVATVDVADRTLTPRLHPLPLLAGDTPNHLIGCHRYHLFRCYLLPLHRHCGGSIPDLVTSTSRHIQPPSSYPHPWPTPFRFLRFRRNVHLLLPPFLSVGRAGGTPLLNNTLYLDCWGYHHTPIHLPSTLLPFGGRHSPLLRHNLAIHHFCSEGILPTIPRIGASNGYVGPALHLMDAPDITGRPYPPFGTELPRNNDASPL